MINNGNHCIETHTGDNPFTYKECGLCHKCDAGHPHIDAIKLLVSNHNRENPLSHKKSVKHTFHGVAIKD